MLEIERDSGGLGKRSASLADASRRASYRAHVSRGVARIFQRGGHTGSNNIVMAFSPPNIVGCLLKKGLQRGGGVTGTLGPPPPPSYALVSAGFATYRPLTLT